MKNFINKILSFFNRGIDCPDCSWLVACDKCSERYSAVDKELKAKGQ